MKGARKMTTDKVKKAQELAPLKDARNQQKYYELVNSMTIEE